MPLSMRLELKALGFEGAIPAETGRPAYHPATPLKIYVYGYLNRVQSSRRLEREAQRNVEVVWLTGRLMPDFKTIADFRKDNGQAIRKVCASFIELCRETKLFTETVVAIDGSKFKAVNNRDRNFTEQKIKSRLAHLDKSVKHYLDDLDRADREPATVPEARVENLKEKIAAIKSEMKKLARIKEQLPAAAGQISLTDPDARSMNSAGKGTGTVGYKRANRGGYQEPHDHCPRGHQRRSRSHTLDRYVGTGPRGAGNEIPYRARRSRLLQWGGDPQMPTGRHDALGAQAADLRRPG